MAAQSAAQIEQKDIDLVLPDADLPKFAIDTSSKAAPALNIHLHC